MQSTNIRGYQGGSLGSSLHREYTGVNPNIKLATFTIIILVNKSFRIACSPG